MPAQSYCPVRLIVLNMPIYGAKVMTADDMRRFRKRWGLSQVELAKALGVSPSTVHNYEGLRQSTKSDPIPRFIELACQALGDNYARLEAAIEKMTDFEDNRRRVADDINARFPYHPPKLAEEDAEK